MIKIRSTLIIYVLLISLNASLCVNAQAYPSAQHTEQEQQPLSYHTATGVSLKAIIADPQDIYKNTYGHYFKKAVKSLRYQRYNEAVPHLFTALNVDPGNPQILELLSLVEHVQQGILTHSEAFEGKYIGAKVASVDRIERIPFEPMPVEPVKITKTIEPVKAYQQQHVSVPVKQAYVPTTEADIRLQEVEQSLNQFSNDMSQSQPSDNIVVGNAITPTIETVSMDAPPLDAPQVRKSQLKEPPVVSFAQPSKNLSDELDPVNTEAAIVERIITLDDALWAYQPNMVIDIEFRQSVIMQAESIERFLNLSEEILSVEQIDRRQLSITAKRRGSGIVHIWEGDRRWTFRFNVILPLLQQAKKMSKEAEWVEKEEQPFRFTYANSWTGFYLGDDLSKLDRQNLTFRQWLGIYGPTPYGDFDASVTYNKFDQSTELIEQRIGLMDAHIGNFKDFSIRVYDTSARFSELSLPGRSFRGVKLDAYAFDHNLKYSLLRGQDRAAFNFSNPSQVVLEKSYIEGSKITFFPEGNHRISLNYAHGYGELRSERLKDKVYSIDTKHYMDELTVNAEVAYDEDKTAQKVEFDWKEEDYGFGLDLRDINTGFQTITGQPAAQGEIGGLLSGRWDRNDWRVLSDLDLYRDRSNFNPDNEEALNLDFQTNVYRKITDTLNTASSLYYSDTPQLLSPRESLRLNQSVSKSFKMFNDRRLSTSLRGSYQRNRYDRSPSSDYDRYSLRGSVNFPIYKKLQHFTNYEISWAEDIQNSTRETPRVLNTGLSYSQKIGHDWRARTSVSYRNEYNTNGNFSFLSGQDYIRGNLNLSYRPTPDYDFFIDATLRNIFPDEDDTFMEGDLRFGVNIAWDTLFSWSPSGIIEGHVFKDTDGDGVYTSGEEGVKDIVINIGDKSVITNEEGYFKGSVRAKRIKAGIDVQTLPKGFVISSNYQQEIKIENGQRHQADFALNVRTGVFGIVFFDENENGRYDDGERTFSGIKVVLDDRKSIQTDFEGIFAFNSISSGKHKVRLDVNSIPLDFLPVDKIVNEVVVQEGSVYQFNIPLKQGETIESLDDDQ